MFIGSDDGYVYGLKAGEKGGQLEWKYQTGGSVRSSPALADFDVYVAYQDGFLYALKEEKGTLIFKYELGGQPESSPALADKSLYIGGSNIACFKQ